MQSKNRKDIRPVRAVNGPERVQLEQAWREVAILNIVEPTARNEKILILLLLFYKTISMLLAANN